MDIPATTLILSDLQNCKSKIDTITFTLLLENIDILYIEAYANVYG